MTAPIAHLSNFELGQVLGITPSGASKMRNGHILPGHETMRLFVEKLGGDWDELNEAAIRARNGDTQPWTHLVDRLTEIHPEPIDQ